MMNNFLSIYLIIGFIFYTIITFFIYFIGIDNIKNMTDDEALKNLDLNSFSANIILLILTLLLWPITLTYTIINNKNN
jgi:hypothetical protein